MIDLIDLHTHTVASGHAYSTIKEMVEAAREKGLKILGITEHGPAGPESCKENYFVNLKVIPRKREGITVLYGVEANILDFEGHIDMPDALLEELDIVIAGIHKTSYPKSYTAEDTTRAYLNLMKNHRIDIISHPDTLPVDFKAVVECAKEYGVLLEVNETSLNPVHFRYQNAIERYEVILGCCKELQVPIVIGSDAHIDLTVGDHSQAHRLLQELDFPEHLIVNGDIEMLKRYLRRPELIRCG